MQKKESNPEKINPEANQRDCKNDTEKYEIFVNEINLPNDAKLGESRDNVTEIAGKDTESFQNKDIPERKDLGKG